MKVTAGEAREKATAQVSRRILTSGLVSADNGIRGRSASEKTTLQSCTWLSSLAPKVDGRIWTRLHAASDGSAFYCTLPVHRWSIAGASLVHGPFITCASCIHG